MPENITGLSSFASQARLLLRLMGEHVMKRTYYQDLGVPWRATQKEIEKAYWGWQEERRARGTVDSAARRAEEAYRTLSEPGRRRSYDRLVDGRYHPAWIETFPGPAQEAYERCLALEREGRRRQALTSARRAVQLDPHSPVYRSHAGLLTAKSGGSIGEALRQGRLAHEQDPRSRSIALNLAAIYDIAGFRKRAARLRRRNRQKLTSLFSS